MSNLRTKTLLIWVDLFTVMLSKALSLVVRAEPNNPGMVVYVANNVDATMKVFLFEAVGGTQVDALHKRSVG